jgi:rhodanese-related sulfurtransferase
MKHKIQWLLTILMLMSMMLAACSPAAPAAPEPVVEEPAAEAPAEEAPAEEPVAEEPAEEEPMEEEAPAEGDLDGNYAAFLAGMEKYNTLSPEALNTMIAEGQEFFLLDVRGPSEAEELGYIEGAVQIPLHDLGKNTDKLPPVDTMMVVYCKAGTRATLGGAALGALGYTNVKILVGNSFGGWLEAGYPIAEGIPAEGETYDVGFAANLVEAVDMALTGINEIGYAQIVPEDLQTALIENPDMILLDVRRQDEVEGKGYIAADNRSHVSLEDFIANMDQWPADKDADIAVHCAGGYRSNIAMTILRAYGYTNVTSLKGGFGGWVAAGMPVEGAPITVSGNYADYFGAMETWNIITPEALNTMIVEGQEVFILDVRNPSEAEEVGHIEGAVQIPLQELGKHTDLLPSLDTPVVVYCKAGTRAVIGATMLGALGYTDVKALIGNSFTGWVEAGYPVVEGVPAEGEAFNVEYAEGLVEAVDMATTGLNEIGWAQTNADNTATAIVENPDLIVIDVRKPAEVVQGVVDAPNFIHLSLLDMITNMDLWPEDKEADIVTYCRSGVRSNIAQSVLRAHGYTNVISMNGGYLAWTDAGYPTMDYMPAVDLETPVGNYLAAMESWNTLSPEALNTMIAEGQDFFLLDLRGVSEAEEKGYIEGAVLIPLQDIGKNTDKLPSLDTPIVAYCAAGTRAVIGATALSALGYTNVKALTGSSYGGWLEAGYPIASGVPAEGEALNTEFDAVAVAALDKAMTGLNEIGWAQTTPENVSLAIVENPDLIVIDVRKPEEVAEGVIDAPNFIHLSLLDMVANIAQWPAEKDADIVVYCKAGTRSNIAMSILRVFGYTNVISMKGGFTAYVEAELPVAEFAAP